MSGNAATLAALTEITDPDHILFGSDFPYMPQETIDDNASGVFGSKAIARVYERFHLQAWTNSQNAIYVSR